MQSILPTDIEAKPSPAPFTLSEGSEIQGVAVCPELYVSRRGECGSGRAELISGCGRGSPCQGMLFYFIILFFKRKQPFYFQIFISYFDKFTAIF
jgi:hypothetical protein